MTSEPWKQPGWIAQTLRLLDSYRKCVGRDLIARTGTAEQQAERLFDAPFVVLSHGTEADPILNFGNRAALTLWETNLPSFLATPSRLTAEPVRRDERAALLERVNRDGFIDDYSGIRISQSGRRFFIERATVWNLVDDEGRYAGQAATFSSWRHLTGRD
ncbi:MAG: MEKHLA domain-containing protein [Planctomycetaceae bacterium]